jgi:hypothetical protein
VITNPEVVTDALELLIVTFSAVLPELLGLLAVQTVRLWPWHRSSRRAFSFAYKDPESFRGLDHLPDIEARSAAEARAAGTAVGSAFSSERLSQLQDLATVRKDPEFAEFVARSLSRQR